MKEFVIETVYEFFMIKSSTMYRATIEGRYICRKKGLKFLRAMTKKTFDEIQFPKEKIKKIILGNPVSIENEIYKIELNGEGLPELSKYKQKPKLQVYEY